MARESQRGVYLVSDDVARLDLELVCDYLRGMSKRMLATRDAHSFYRALGFLEIDEPGWLMEQGS